MTLGFSGIVAYAFGVPATIRANLTIARIAANKAHELGGAWIYTQSDVQFKEGDCVTAFYMEEEPGNPPPTLRIARGAVRLAMRDRISKLYIVAAKPHMWRALRDTRMAVKEAGADIEVIPCEEVDQYPDHVWFCPDSTQDRTQTREAWEGRERILRIMPYFIYKRVAS